MYPILSYQNIATLTPVYCLIKHLNTEGGYADLVHSTSFINDKIIIKNEIINNYSAVCTIRGCYVCELIQH